MCEMFYISAINIHIGPFLHIPPPEIRGIDQNRCPKFSYTSCPYLILDSFTKCYLFSGTYLNTLYQLGLPTGAWPLNVPHILRPHMWQFFIELN